MNFYCIVHNMKTNEEVKPSEGEEKTCSASGVWRELSADLLVEFARNSTYFTKN